MIPAAPGLLIVPALFFIVLGSAFNVPFKRYVRALVRGRRDAAREKSAQKGQDIPAAAEQGGKDSGKESRDGRGGRDE